MYFIGFYFQNTTISKDPSYAVIQKKEKITRGNVLTPSPYKHNIGDEEKKKKEKRED